MHGNESKYIFGCIDSKYIDGFTRFEMWRIRESKNNQSGIRLYVNLVVC